MPFPWQSSSQFALLAVLVISCSSGEPIEPPIDPGGATRLIIGDTTAVQTLPSGQLRNEHLLTVSTRTEIAIFVQGVDGGVTVEGELDGEGDVLGAYAYPGQQLSLLQVRTNRFMIPAGKTLKVRVRRYGTSDSTSTLHYRLFPYRVNRAPEHVPATVVLGEVQGGEDIETSADIDEYALVGQVGNDVVGYLANDGPAPGGFYLGFFDPTDDLERGGIIAPAIGMPLEDNGSPMFTATPGSFVVRVSGGDYGLPSNYTFVIRQGNRAPETAPATVGTNAEISESFDYTGDVDEFTVHGTPGVLVNIMLGIDSAEPMTPYLETFGEGVWPRVASIDNSPLNATTGAMPVPPSGDMRFRVINGHQSGVTITGRGAYHVRVVQIDPGPETAPAALTGTDSIIGEEIDEYDDRDEFTLTWPVGGLANIVLRTNLPPPDPFRAWGPLVLHLTGLAGDSIQSVVLPSGREPGGIRPVLASCGQLSSARHHDLRGRPGIFQRSILCVHLPAARGAGIPVGSTRTPARSALSRHPRTA